MKVLNESAKNQILMKKQPADIKSQAPEQYMFTPQLKALPLEIIREEDEASQRSQSLASEQTNQHKSPTEGDRIQTMIFTQASMRETTYANQRQMTIGMDMSTIAPARMTSMEKSVANDANLTSFLGNEILLVDMGQVEDEDRPYLIVDKDSGKVYDIRKAEHVEHLTPKPLQQPQAPPQLEKQSSWASWWKEKRKNNNDYLQAVEKGDIQKMRQLLDPLVMQDLVADINIKGLDQWHALHFSANEGHTELTQELLSFKSTEVQPRTSTMRTPLHLAASRGYVDICKLFCESENQDLNAVDQDENTALHFATQFGHLRVIEYFISQTKVDHTLKNKFGYMAYDIALNLEVRQLFDSTLGNRSLDENKAFYGRTQFNGVLRHNDRVSQLKNLMLKFGQVNKHLQTTNHNVDALVERLEQQEEQKDSLSEIKLNSGKEKSKWESKFIKIWEQTEAASKQEAFVGPKHFKAIMKLGQGSFGVVYLVEKLKLDPVTDVATPEGKFYAMKILNKKQILGQNLVKYAKTERDVLTQTKHPFIVGLKFAFQTPEKLFLLLDYAPGGNMSRALQKDRRFEEDRARYYLAEILLSLEDLHKRDIIFRDLKPDNIVFDVNGHALLTDFGLSKEGMEKNTLAKSFCGSPAYLAPEMLKRQGHGRSVDWYLLGVLLYEMLVGIPPYYSNNKEVLYQNIQQGPLQLPKFLSEEARALLIALLNRNPYKRLGSGTADAKEIKDHIFFTKANINWNDVRLKKLPVPAPYTKRLMVQDIPMDKVYGRGAFDNSLQHLNRVNEWSFIRKY